MRTLGSFFFSAAGAAFLLYCPTPMQAQTAHEPADLERRFARHFSDNPPLHFEVEEHGEHGPRIIITNLYQYLLTAYLVQSEPKSAGDPPQTLIGDALSRLALPASIPRGLSYATGLPHVEGGLAPDAKVVAAIWEDGSTFGPDELLLRISNRRKALADSYDLAIATLQTGLEKNWSVQEYIAMAGKLKAPTPQPPPATVEDAKALSESFSASMLPGQTITGNMQHAIQHDLSPAQVSRLAQALLNDFQQSRDALLHALGGSSTSSNQTKN
jgi:hypothetical protein